MMRPMSMQDQEWFTPTRYGGRDDARQYLLGPLHYGERLAIDNHTLARWGEGAMEQEIWEEIRNGIAVAFFSEDERSRAHATLDTFTEALAAFREAAKGIPPGTTNGQLPPEVQEAQARVIAALGPSLRLQSIVSRAHPPLSQLLSVNQVRRGEVRIQFAKRGVRDWKNVGRKKDGVWQPVLCARERDLLTDQSLACIPDEDLEEIEAKLRELSDLTEADRGNSASPSGVSAIPAQSTAD